MLVLALDSSTLDLSLALAEGQPGFWKLLGEARYPPGINHSVLLPKAIEDLLSSQGKHRREVSAIVAGVGPGSFTGLRIGLACVKGLAYAQRIPLLGASSIEAMALAGFSLSSRTFGPILPFTDADIDATLAAFRKTLTAIDDASGGSE